MSTPLIWIILPLLIVGLTLLLTNRPLIMKWIGAGSALVLALSGLILPINQAFQFLFWKITISDQLLVFGRRFVLGAADRPVVALLFFLVGFWFLAFEPGVFPVQTVPLGLAGIVLTLTAFAVEPLFYGALFFAFLTLIYVVLLSPPGSKPTPGVLRFLIFQILGILFILFAAWLASWIDLNSDDQLLLNRSLVILGLGFALLLAVFPFISWIPMVAEKNHPYLVGFVLNCYLSGVFLFASRFITEGGWISQGIGLQPALQFAGIMMLSVGGILGVFSHHLGRLTSALMIAEIGRALLAFSLFMTGFPIYFAMLIIQTLGLGVWSASLANLGHSTGDLKYESAAGILWNRPVTTSGILIGYFSLAGLPLLAGFPIYWSLGSGLSFFPLWIPIAYLAASSGLLLGGLRIFSLVTRKAGADTEPVEGSGFYRYFVLTINLFLILLGLFPQVLVKLTDTITRIMISSP